MKSNESPVITGVGIATPISVAWNELPRIINNPQTGTSVDLNGLFVEMLGSKGLKYLDRCTRLTMLAGMNAASSGRMISDNSTLMEEYQDKVGMVLGTTLGGLKSISSFDYASLEGVSPLHVNPLDFPNTTINSPASHLAIKLLSKGPNLTISNGHSSGLDALLMAKMLLESNMAHIVFAGGAEELSDEYLAGYNSIVPGGSPSEGSALLVMETAECAAKRGVRPLAVFAGGAMGIAHPGNKDGVERAAGIIRATTANVGKIDLVLSVSNSNSPARQMESAALNAVLGTHDILDTSLLGDSYSGSGALLAATATALIQDGADRILVSAFGSSGQGTCVVLEVP